MRVILYDPDPRLDVPAAVARAQALGLALGPGDRVVVRNPRAHKPGEREPADCVIIPEAFPRLAEEYIDAGVRVIGVRTHPQPLLERKPAVEPGPATIEPPPPEPLPPPVPPPSPNKAAPKRQR